LLDHGRPEFSLRDSREIAANVCNPTQALSAGLRL
jgi:hypothetical protein